MHLTANQVTEWYFQKLGKDCETVSAEILYARHASESTESVIVCSKEMLSSSLGFNGKKTPCLTKWLSTAVLQKTKIHAGYLKELL